MFTLIIKMHQQHSETRVLIIVKCIHQDSQYGASIIPIILMDSLIPDSFSLTMRKTELYTGGIYEKRMNRGSST